MASAGAERQRRYRAHKRGDHSLCDPARDCDAVTVTRDVTSPAVERAANATPPGLGAGGRRLWRALVDDLVADPLQIAMLEEACRIKDRLDKLDRLLTGDAEDWVRLVEDRGDPERQVVVMDKSLSEARQQATALKQIVAEIRQARSPAKPSPARPAGRGRPASGVTPPATESKGAGGVSDLAARIAARRAQTAG